MRLSRINRERRTLIQMIRLHCQARHAQGALPCPECQQLIDYAIARIDRCCFGLQKPTCKECPVHCYAKEPREQVRRVMRYAGPRMLWKHPWLTLLHLVEDWQSKRLVMSGKLTAQPKEPKRVVKKFT